MLNLTYDKMFKSFLLKGENKSFLIHLIHGITKIPLKSLQNIKIQNTEHIIYYKNQKIMKSDIIVSTCDTIINLEMNRKKYEGLFERNIEYLEKISVTKNALIREYGKGKKIIQINFNNFHMENTKPCISKYHYKSYIGKHILTKIREIYLVDLEMIKNMCYNKPEVNLFERQCLLMKAETKEEALKLIEGSEIMEKAVNTLLALNNDPEILLYYDEDEEREKVTRARITTARNEGERFGISKGKKLGLTEGISKGKKLGLAKGISLVASNLLKENIDIELISKTTGLSIKDIRSLQMSK